MSKSLFVSRKLSLSVALFLIGDIVQAAPITFNTALPVGKEEFIFRGLGSFVKAKRDSSPLNRDLENWQALAVLGYGISENLALFGALPYQWNHIKLNSSDSKITRSAKNIGDMMLFARYTIFKIDWPQKTWRLAPLGGLQLPTGEKSSKDIFGRKPQSIQPGLGSWNPFVGLVTTYQTLGYQIDAQVSYKKHTNPRSNFRHGDTLRFDASLQYRLWPSDLGKGVPHFLYGVLETNIIHNRKNKFFRVKDPNSGGTTVFLVPGVQYVMKRIILETGVQIPIIQDLNGSALKNNYAILAGFRVNF